MNNINSKSRDYVSLTVCGIGIGWLMGLSTSPTISAVIAAVLTAVTGVVSSLAGVEIPHQEKQKDTQHTESEETKTTGSQKTTLTQRGVSRVVTPAPLAILIVGLTCGSAAGVYARTHNVLGADSHSLIAKWKDTKLPDTVIAQRLFDRMYPPLSSSTPADKTKISNSEDKSKKPSNESRTAPTDNQSYLGGGLFSGFKQDVVQSLRNCVSPNEYRSVLKESGDKRLVNFEKNCPDDQCLINAVKELICSDSSN